MKERPSFLIRPYEHGDRAAVRAICCNTGFLGNPVDPLFEDRELFADYLTRYYTDMEPESSVVLVQEGRITGYMTGCCHPDRQDAFNAWHNVWLALRGFWGYATRYGPASKKFVHWVLTEGWRQVPYAPPDTAHFHINLLPESRNVAQTRALIEAFLEMLVRAGQERVYGQMVVFENRRGERMFARYGFEVVDKVEVTKYRDLTDTPVFLFTVVKDLRKNQGLYGTDLWKVRELEQG